MKEKHERDVAYITKRRGDKSGEDALKRPTTRPYTTSTTTRVRRKVGALVSFSWITAATHLKEAEKLPGSGVLLQ